MSKNGAIQKLCRRAAAAAAAVQIVYIVCKAFKMRYYVKISKSENKITSSPIIQGQN